MADWYKCPYCGIELPTRELLENHIAVDHPQEPPAEVYTCPYCGATFDTSSALSSHISIVHPPEPEPVYTCPQCGAQFSTQAALSYHISTAHPVVPPPVYTCPHCGATFDSEAGLSYHISTAHPPEPEPEPPPVVSLPWIGSIFSFVWDIADWFLSAYEQVSGWIWPLHYLQYPLYGIYQVLKSMLTPIADFWLWAEDIASKIKAAWDADGLLGLIKWWFPWLYDIGEWFYYRWQWFLTAVGDWWDSTKTTVLGWIDIAVQGFNALLVWWDEFWKIIWPGWMATLEALGSDISDFFTHTLPTLFDISFAWEWWGHRLKEVQELMTSNLKEWFPFYDDIVEFFSDPGEYLLAKLADWFLGKEE